MRCQRIFNGVDTKGNRPIVVNFQVRSCTAGPESLDDAFYMYIEQRWLQSCKLATHK